MSTPDAKGRPSGASGFKNLRAMFEAAGSSSSPQSPAAAEPFKPKPIGRVKTNFVAIEGQNGQVGLKRLDELGKVMAQMTGNKSHWDWKKFKIAVQNLGCELASPILIYIRF